jgi:hypothetical protein
MNDDPVVNHRRYMEAVAKDEEIRKAEIQRDAERAERYRLEQREVIGNLQGDREKKIPAACRHRDRCPLGYEGGHVGATPSQCYWSCGVTTENRNA